MRGERPAREVRGAEELVHVHVTGPQPVCGIRSGKTGTLSLTKAHLDRLVRTGRVEVLDDNEEEAVADVHVPQHESPGDALRATDGASVFEHPSDEQSDE